MKPPIEATLRELLDFAQRHGLEEISWRDEDFKIAFRRGAGGSNGAAPEADAAVEAEPAAPAEELVRAPMVGIFRRSASKDRPPLVMEGNHVKPGDRVAVVECMKIPTDVISYADGAIGKILVEDGQPVEYGQPLFTVLPGAPVSTNGAA